MSFRERFAHLLPFVPPPDQRRTDAQGPERTSDELAETCDESGHGRMLVEEPVGERGRLQPIRDHSVRFREPTFTADEPRIAE